MFVFGGYTGDIYSNSNLRNKNDLFEYKFTTSQWINWEEKITGALPPARSAHGAAVFKNKLWIFAGYDGHMRLNDMWTIDLLSEQPQWEQITQTGDSPPTCCNFPVAIVDDSMYVFSGQSGARITNNLYQFKFEEQLWVRIRTDHLLCGSPCPPQRRYGHTMVAYSRCLYVFGGAADGILDNEVHCFDVDSRTWSVVHPAEGSDIPCGRVFHSAAVWGNSFYVFGGTVDSVSSRSGDLYCFTFSQFPKCTLVDDFARLLETEQFCDVHFLLSSPSMIIVKAHAAVVAARSPYLRQKIIDIYHQQTPNYEAPPIYSAQFTRQEPLEVPLPEVSPEVFRMVLYSMYTDHIHPDLENHSREGMSAQQMLLMMEVYKLALLFNTKRLELLSMQYIEASINLENVLLVLCSASELKLTRMREFCMKFIVRDTNYRKVIMSSSFERLDRSVMVQIIRRQQFRSRPTSPDPHTETEERLPSSLQDDLEAFLLGDMGRPFTDVILQVNSHSVPAHIPILATRCSYFEALFRSFMPESGRVDITFGKTLPTLQAFNSLLKFIYYGEVRMPPADCLYIFSAPNFFGFSNLQLHSHCKARLEKDVRNENVLQMLEAADDIAMEPMKRHCLQLIAGSFPTIVKMPQFRSLKRELLLDISDVLASKME